jgi:hypothetical protein
MLGRSRGDRDTGQLWSNSRNPRRHERPRLRGRQDASDRARYEMRSDSSWIFSATCLSLSACSLLW